MLAIGFDIAPRDYAEASEFLTGQRRCAGPTPSETDKTGFLTYRYSTTPGNIIRTFTLVTPMSTEYPFCWFQNFYRYPERQLIRDCSGVVVKLGNAIYMLGMLPPHEGFKLLVLPCSAGQAGRLSGLIATANNGGTPLMARVGLERVEATRLQMLVPEQMPGILQYPVAKGARPDDEILWRIRNHIKFEVGGDIVLHAKSGREKITAARMKDIVEKRCRGMFTLGKVPFNPADHIHYPFNQALTLYSGDERTKRSK